jgi:hypothetical protein
VLALLARLIFIDYFSESLCQLIVFSPYKKESEVHLPKVFYQGTAKDVRDKVEELNFQNFPESHFGIELFRLLCQISVLLYDVFCEWLFKFSKNFLNCVRPKNVYYAEQCTATN